MTKQRAIKHFWILVPIIGTILFLLLYFVSALFYPGGSQVDKNSVGFSWANNYWCNLLNDKAINGESNPAQPIAVTAMFILCATLTLFWVQFPKYTSINKANKLTIQISGSLAMFIGIFLFTKYDHDLITNLASVFGLIATLGTFIVLFKNRWTMLFYFGILNILLVVINNILYYNKDIIFYLPIVQKITFMTFLIWICLICYKIYRLQKKKIY